MINLLVAACKTVRPRRAWGDRGAHRSRACSRHIRRQ